MGKLFKNRGKEVCEFISDEVTCRNDAVRADEHVVRNAFDAVFLRGAALPSAQIRKVDPVQAPGLNGTQPLVLALVK